MASSSINIEEIRKNLVRLDEDLKQGRISLANYRKEQLRFAEDIQSLNNKLRSTQTGMRKLKDAGVENGKAYKDLTSQEIRLKKAIDKKSGAYERNRQVIDSLKNKIKEYQNTIDVKKEDIPLKMLSYNELVQRRSTLADEFKKGSPNTEQTEKLKKELSSVTRELNRQTIALKDTRCWMSKSASGINQYLLPLVSLGGLIYKGIDALKSYTKEYVHLTDVLADVRKTTGLCQEEVESLNASLRQMDTRTSQENLLNLARDAGKLGISGVDNIRQFVSAADKIKVALGEDLGEEAITNIGKMSDVFGLTKTMGIEESYMRIGSSINELGQSSTASEQYLVDFSQRLSGVGAQAGISIEDILGYASALNQSGQQVEVSATTFQNLITKIFSEPAKFAKIAGLELSRFKELLDRDVNGAIRHVLTSLNSQGGFSHLIPIFESMNMDGSRAIGVLAALAKNIGAVEEAQRISNDAFAAGSSLMEEFSVKNNTAAATEEKRTKTIQQLKEELGESVLPLLELLEIGILNVSKVLVGLVKCMLDNWIVVVSLTGAMLSLRLATNGMLQTLIVYLKNFQLLNNIKRAGLLLVSPLTIAYNLFQMGVYKCFRATTKFKAAQEALNAVLKKNPFILILSVVVALGVGIATLFKHLNAGRREMNEFLSGMNKEKAEAEGLFYALKHANKESAEYKKIRSQIIGQYGQYLEGLISEKGELTDIEEAYKRVTQAIGDMYVAKQLQDKKEAAIGEAMDEQIPINQKIREYAVSSKGAGAGDVMANKIIQATREKSEGEMERYLKKLGVNDVDQIQDYMKQIKKIYDIQNDLEKDIQKIDKTYGVYSAEYRDSEELSLIRNKIKTKQTQLVKKKEYDRIIASYSGRKRDLNATTENPLQEELQANYSHQEQSLFSKTNEAYFVKEIQLLQVKERKMNKKITKRQPSVGSTSEEPSFNASLDSGSSTSVTESKEKESMIKCSEELSKLQEELYKNQRRNKLSSYELELDDLNDLYDEKISKYTELEAQAQKVLNADNTTSKDKKEAQKVIDSAQPTLLLIEEERGVATRSLSSKYEKTQLEELKKFVEAQEAVLEEQQARAHQNKLTTNQLEINAMHDKYDKIIAEIVKCEKEVRTILEDPDTTEVARKEAKLFLAGVPDSIATVNKNRGSEAQITRTRQVKELEEKYNFSGQDNNELSLRERRNNALIQLEEDLTAKRDALRAQEQEGTEAYIAALAGIDQEGNAKRLSIESTFWNERKEIAAKGLELAGQLMSTASELVTSLKESEMDSVEMQYEREKEDLDEMLENKMISKEEYDERYLALEEKKQEDQKEIQKKYVDIEFALKVGQIIASTALAAMQAYSSCAAIPLVGPVLGGVAAGIAVAAGAVQIGIATQERQKAKGYAQGGFTGDGGVDTPAGVVHKGEYVIPQHILRTEDGMNYALALEALRTHKNLAEYSSGGWVANSETSNLSTGEYSGLIGSGVSNNSQTGTPEMIMLLKSMNDKLSGVDIVVLKKRLDKIAASREFTQSTFGIQL